MSARHAFIDESTRRGYLVCAVVLAPTDLVSTRRALRSLCLPGQQRIHMTKEGTSRRRRILSEIQAFDFETLLYETKIGGRSQRSARDDCLRVIVPDLLQRKVRRLVVESCDQDRQDVRVISDAVAKEEAHDRFHYLHAAPTSEPLLWLPDILAWAYGAGGDWLRRASITMSAVTKIDG